ncbi:very short patch repair endonuclease [Chryseobacterium tongliaoense]|uniref:very short patch repair endonuclease n=1 Tax=Chryseobacterium tongliaoense TaxID=3240933 RepID=UPI0035155345
MADIFDHKKRSEIMSKIAGKETKPEILIRKQLFAKGFRYRKNVKELPGKPDIVLPKYKTVIFINGCFWHGHSCKKAVLPSTRTEFWSDKIAKNKERDLKNYQKLHNDGWNIIVVWQCEMSNKLQLSTKIEEIEKLLRAT